MKDGVGEMSFCCLKNRTPRMFYPLFIREKKILIMISTQLKKLPFGMLFAEIIWNQ
jgi:hypothetical protein